MRELASSIGRMLHGWKNYLGLRWRNEREGLSLCSKRRDPLTGSSASPGVLLYVGAKREAALRDFHQSARTWDAFVEVARGGSACSTTRIRQVRGADPVRATYRDLGEREVYA